MEEETKPKSAKPYRPYKPPGFRPPSLSIVTVTPEVQKSLQNLRNTNNVPLETLAHRMDGYDARDFRDDDFTDDEEEDDNHNNSSNNITNFQPQMSIVDEDENEESSNVEKDNSKESNVPVKVPLDQDDEHRFYYKTPQAAKTSSSSGHARNARQLTSQISQSSAPDFSTSEIVNPMNKNNNGHIAKVEGSLLRYVLPQPPQTPNGNHNKLNNLLGPNYDSISAASFRSDNYRKAVPPSILKHSISRDELSNNVNNTGATNAATGTNGNIKTNNLNELHLDHKDQTEDAASIGDCSISQSDHSGAHNHSEHQAHANRLMNDRMFTLLSVMYALGIVVLGAVVTGADLGKSVNDNDHLYSIVITLIGMAFLAFIHFDVQRHKSFVMDWERRRKAAIEAPMKSAVDLDSVSVTTAVIFNRTWTCEDENDQIAPEVKERLNGYRFLTGKHSGNFYLKIGMTLFCMGSIVHQGINVAIQAHFYMIDSVECQNAISITVYLVRCLFAFYQLYMAFKYSNLIINRNTTLVRFGMMHLVGTSMSFWFSTIIEEAMDGYATKIRDYKTNKTASGSMLVFMEEVTFQDAVAHQLNCSKNSLSSFESMDTIPLLYPFSVEYNIILASVWYMIWTNIGSNEASQLSHIREEIAQDEKTGQYDVQYRSNLTINADCHASNMGLFGGLLTLLLVLTSTIVFFTTIKHNDYHDIGIALYTGQFGFLTLCCLISVPLAMRHMRRLNVVSHHHLDNSATAMDDLLLLVPLPFFYVHHILCIYTEFQYGSTNSITMAIFYILHLVQVTWQTPFLVDGIRRCSNDRKMRFKKPGKGLITFLIIINVTLWILITFEIKSVDKYHSMAKYFGKFTWMVILDTCLPLMLFYRFHSSVCLSDMWQHAYEKDEH